MAAPSSIVAVSFAPLTTNDNKKMSVLKIINSDLHDAKGTPISGGIYDLKMGTTDHMFNCTTCDHGKKYCAGHRGHLDLKLGFIQPIALMEVKKWLRIICLSCGGLIVEKSKYEGVDAHKRFEEIADLDPEGKSCPNEYPTVVNDSVSSIVMHQCKKMHPKIVGDPNDNFTLYADFNISEKKLTKGMQKSSIIKPRVKLYPEMILKIFEKIPQDLVNWLGRSVHPRDYIVKTINIPPNTIRPTPKSFSQGIVAQHDYTAIFQYIIRNNTLLQSTNTDPNVDVYDADNTKPVDKKIDEIYNSLQLLYYNLIKGSSAAKTMSSSKGKKRLAVGQKQIESIMSKMSSKEGRVRNNLLGKRTFNISRTTISGNSLYKIDELGIPLVYAKTMQVKRVFQHFNASYLMIFFNNKHYQYPGSTQIIKKINGLTYDVNGLQNYLPESGDIISCDVTNGDALMFNRQPTLEHSSMGVHYAVVVLNPNAHTFQFNVLACENYNADYDGDQMNGAVAQTRSSSTEVIILSSVAAAFISPKSSGPLNGQTQDSVLGLYKMTLSGVTINKRCAVELFSGISSPNFDKYPADHIFTGRDIVSLILEPYPINFSGTPYSLNKAFAPYLKFDRAIFLHQL